MKSHDKNTWPFMVIFLIVLFLKVLFTLFYLVFQKNDELNFFSDLTPSVVHANEFSITNLVEPPAVLAANSINPQVTSQVPEGMFIGAAMVVSANSVPNSSETVNNSVQKTTDSSIPLPPGYEDLTKPQDIGQLGLKPQTPPNSANDGAAKPINESSAVSSQTSISSTEMARREQELKVKEDVLKQMENDLNSKLKNMEDAKKQIEELNKKQQSLLEEQKAFAEQQKKDEEDLKNARVEHLVIAYKSMKPEQAGGLIDSMDDDVAVSILSAMPGRNAGQILANVEPAKAARLTKAISEQKMDPNLPIVDTQVAP